MFTSGNFKCLLLHMHCQFFKKKSIDQRKGIGWHSITIWQSCWEIIKVIYRGLFLFLIVVSDAGCIVQISFFPFLYYYLIFCDTIGWTINMKRFRPRKTTLTTTEIYFPDKKPIPLYQWWDLNLGHSSHSVVAFTLILATTFTSKDWNLFACNYWYMYYVKLTWYCTYLTR